jgi:hypothetical protein
MEAGLSLRECERVLDIGKTNVNDIVRNARAAGVNWTVTQSLSDEELEARLYHPAALRSARIPHKDLSFTGHGLMFKQHQPLSGICPGISVGRARGAPNRLPPQRCLCGLLLQAERSHVGQGRGSIHMAPVSSNLPVLA